MTEKDDKLLLVTLNAIPGLGPRKIQKLAMRFKNYKTFLEAKREDFLEINGVGEIICEKILEYRSKFDPYKEIEKANNLNIKVITLKDDKYPFLLKEIYDPPPVLYFKGTTPLSPHSIAIVGSRKASAYGKNVAAKFARELAAVDINIVSGMARGIDSCAHKGALEAKGFTIAVLGCGIDIVYPPENTGLMKDIVESGCVISSFPLGTPPQGANFPARNRIISGLSLGTLVVEAAKKSGSLITADFSLEQGREVFAVPGSIFNPYSSGTHKLIKQGAKLVENVEDILDELYLENLPESIASSGKANKPDLTCEEKGILDIIDYQPTYIEEIISLSHKTPGSINILLTHLELKGYISALGGGYFAKI